VNGEHVFDDLAMHQHLPELVDWARLHVTSTVPMRVVRSLVCGRAAVADVERYGDEWVAAMVSLLERSGLGHPWRDDSGVVLIRLVEPLPDAEAIEAGWRMAYWDGAPPAD